MLLDSNFLSHNKALSFSSIPSLHLIVLKIHAMEECLWPHSLHIVMIMNSKYCWLFRVADQNLNSSAFTLYKPMVNYRFIWIHSFSSSCFSSSRISAIVLNISIILILPKINEGMAPSVNKARHSMTAFSDDESLICFGGLTYVKYTTCELTMPDIYPLSYEAIRHSYESVKDYVY